MTYQYGPQLRPSQRQILYGTILGGSSVVRPERGKNCYLAMRDRHYDWLSYKVQELSGFFKEDQNTVKRDKNTYRCYSIAYPVFNEVFDVFYRGKQKVITRETLEMLTDEAWMVWFLDAGRRSRRKAYLRTHKFGEAGTLTIAEYFNSLDCFCEPHIARNRHELVFTNHGAFELLRTIAPKIPKFMQGQFD